MRLQAASPQGCRPAVFTAGNRHQEISDVALATLGGVSVDLVIGVL